MHVTFFSASLLCFAKLWHSSVQPGAEAICMHWQMQNCQCTQEQWAHSSPITTIIDYISEIMKSYADSSTERKVAHVFTCLVVVLIILTWTFNSSSLIWSSFSLMSIVSFLHSVSNSLMRRRSVSVHSPLSERREKKKKRLSHISAHEKPASNKPGVKQEVKMVPYLDAAASATALAAVASSNFFRFFSSASCFSAVARASCSALSLFSSWPTACLSFCFACTALWSLRAHIRTKTPSSS